MEKRRREFIQGLRELAAFYEANPDLEAPVLRSFDIYTSSKEKLRQYARRFGSFKKRQVAGYFVLQKEFGNINLEVNIKQEKVCRRVKVGEEEVPAKPAHTKPIYKYECPDSLLQEESNV